MIPEAPVKILLVDDRPENLLALEAILEGQGYHLIRAGSGEEALKQVLRHDFALILLDVQMPGLNGFETAELIKSREKSRHVPIIFLTAINKEEQYVFAGYSVGAVDYLFKPLNPDILRSKVAVFVDLHRKNQQLQQQSVLLQQAAQRERERTVELEEQKTFNELILNSAGEGILGVDKEGRVALFNHAAAAMLGYGPGELIGKPVHETLHHSKRDGTPYPAENCPLYAACRQGRAMISRDDVFWRRDGTPLDVEVMCSPVLGRHPILGVVITFKDIAARKRADNELMRQQEELRQANEELLKADCYKDEFLSVISHELRTPLNFIMGFASVLDEEVAGPMTENQHVYMQRILYGADRMLTLVDDLLDFAKVQAGKLVLSRRPQSYEPLVVEVLQALRPLADQKEIALEHHIDVPGLPWLDEHRISQVLTNLISNGIKFTPQGGSVTLKAWVEAGVVVTEVVDTGAGIAAEDLPYLFVRFKQLDMSATREAGGTGLGLSITKALVEAHGGAIEVFSPGRGQGARFRFTLPIHAEPAAAVPVGQSEQGAA